MRSDTVRRVRFVAWFILVSICLANFAKAESSEEQRKRELFLRAREDMRSLQTPSPSKPQSKPEPAPRASSTPRAPEPKPDDTPVKRASTPEPAPVKRAETPEPTPVRRAESPKPTPKEEATPKPTPTPKQPEPTPTPRVKSTPEKKEEKPKSTPIKAPIKIEKSGLQKDQGLEPPKKGKGFSLFGPKYKYLTPSVRREIDNAKVKKGRWKYIIVHNSGTRQGNAKAFHIYHLRTRKMANGLAYHFVIGNGRGAGDGEIEVGGRWRRQINGGHVASDYLNNISLGICLVGDINRDKPTQAPVGCPGGTDPLSPPAGGQTQGQAANRKGTQGNQSQADRLSGESLSVAVDASEI